MDCQLAKNHSELSEISGLAAGVRIGVEAFKGNTTKWIDWNGVADVMRRIEKIADGMITSPDPSLPEGPAPEGGKELDGSASLADAARLLEMLKRIQYGTEMLCPDCALVITEPGDHSTKCELAQTIRFLEAKPAERSEAEQIQIRRARDMINVYAKPLAEPSPSSVAPGEAMRKALAEAERGLFFACNFLGAVIGDDMDKDRSAAIKKIYDAGCAARAALAEAGEGKP